MTLAYPWEHPVSTFTWGLGTSSQVSVWRVAVWISEESRAQVLFHAALQGQVIFHLCLLVKIIIVNIFIAQFKGFLFSPVMAENTYWPQPLLAGDSNLGNVMFSSVLLDMR